MDRIDPAIAFSKSALLSVLVVATSWKITKTRRLRVTWKELGVYDCEIDGSHSKWTAALGVLVNAYLIRQKLAQ